MSGTNSSRFYVLSLTALSLTLLLGVEVAYKMGFSSTAFAATTVSSTNLATPSLRIDTSSAPSSSTSGVADLDITTAASSVNVAGQHLTLNLGETSALGQSGIAGMGYTTVLNGPAGGIDANNIAIGSSITLTPGSASDSASAMYVGELISAINTNASTSSFRGYSVEFPNVLSGATGMTGAMLGFHGNLSKNAGSGDISGSSITVRNSGTSTAAYVTGQYINMDIDLAATTSSNGLWINSTGDLDLKDGIKISGTNIDDMIDLTGGPNMLNGNAIHFGDSQVMRGDADLYVILGNDASENTLEILNEGAGVGSLTVEGKARVSGGLEVRTEGQGSSVITRHQSVTGPVTATINGGTCATMSTGLMSGLSPGDTVIATPTPTDGGIETLMLTWNAFVNSSNQLSLRICNPTGGQLVPTAGQTWRYDIWRH